MISMGGSASRDSGSAKAVCALNMLEFCCSCGRDISHHSNKRSRRGWILRGLLSKYKGRSLLDNPEE